jgi:hypothetical protein
MQCRQSIPDHLFSTLLLEKPLPVQYRFTANLSSSNGKECTTKECKPGKTVCFRPRKYRGTKTPHKKPKEEANFPIPFCTETNQATDDFATQSSEGGGRKARVCIYASRLLVCPLRLCVASPSRSLCPSAWAREDSSCGVPAFSSSSSLNHVSSTTHFSSVSKRMETFQEDEQRMTSFCDTRV